MVAVFEVGKTYTRRSSYDNGCIFAFTVVKRTEKTVTVIEADGPCLLSKPKTCRPYIYDGAEVIRPLGGYAGSPTIAANREA